MFALVDFLRIRPNRQGPLFIDQSGIALKRPFVADAIKLLVPYAGLNPSVYNTRLRIGRTTDLAKDGIPLAIIKETGRWSSQSHVNYIRFPAFTLPM